MSLENLINVDEKVESKYFNFFVYLMNIHIHIKTEESLPMDYKQH